MAASASSSAGCWEDAGTPELPSLSCDEAVAELGASGPEEALEEEVEGCRRAWLTTPAA